MTRTIEAVVPWLLDSDPALRWQVERDLLGADDQVWQQTRSRVATEGLGARLLAEQDLDTGLWAGGAFFPAGFDLDTIETDGQPWTATTWSLTQLRLWGLDPAVLRERRTVELLATHARWEYDDLPYWSGEVDCCINAMTLANGTWLGADPEVMATLAHWFVAHRQPDGGWNCAWVDGSTASSYHSTLNSLVGLLAWEHATGGDDEVRAARHAGQEWLLERHLLRRLSTGEQVGDFATHLAHPTRWSYDVLRGLEHLRDAAGLDGSDPDPRAGEAAALVRDLRRPDGTWLQGERAPGRVWFEVDVAPGEPSPWLTLRATRALAWWDGGS